MDGDALFLLVLLVALAIAFIAYVIRNSANVQQRADELFRKWSEASLDVEKARVRAEARVELERWKANEEMKIRTDALSRSDHTHFGKMTEHLVPWLADMPFDPRDMRFIGSPVDFIVFDGLSSGRPITVFLLEVKTGKNTRLTAREERVREAALATRINYRLLKIKRPSADAASAS